MQHWQPHELHQFVNYPTGHAFANGDSCVKCGRSRKAGIHARAGRRRARIRWTRIFNNAGRRNY